jgi:hypothetical protein
MAIPHDLSEPKVGSEFRHPDAAITFTILARYQDGLSKKELRDVVKGLNELPEGMRQTKYRYVLLCFPYFECYVVTTATCTCLFTGIWTVIQLNCV